MHAKKLIQEVAAKALGGNPDGYQLADGRVFSGGRSMTFAQGAQKAIELGGKDDGHEARDGQSRSFVAGFAEVEVDVETGAFTILEFAAVSDVGTVLNPRSLQGQT